MLSCATNSRIKTDQRYEYVASRQPFHRSDMPEKESASHGWIRNGAYSRLARVLQTSKAGLLVSRHAEDLIVTCFSRF
jgi:hypothetical protein